MELEKQIKVVAVVRGVALVIRDARDKALEEWNNTHRCLLDDLTQAGANVAVEEAALRELTLKAYAETGIKTPAVGVGIREVTKLAYDNGVALDWAKSHSMALSLDKRAFEKIAKADTPDFVSITTEPQATIATNLKV